MKLFFYLNGFNSAIPDDFSNSPKIVAAAEYALDQGFRFIPVSIDYRRTAAHFEHILERLDDRDREAIVSRLELGQSWQQVAVVLGKPSPDAARMAVSRALRRLVEEMEHETRARPDR